MKRLTALLLAALLLLSCGACASQGSSRVNPITFYYKRADVSFDDGTGVIYGLDVDLEDRDIAISEIVSLYLEGPDEQNLDTPFPPGVTLADYVWNDGLLTLTFSNELCQLTGLDTTVAMACLTMTLTQISGVDGICVLTQNGKFSYKNGDTLRPEDFVLTDTGAKSGKTTVNLYFSDAEGRYLLLDTRAVDTAAEPSVPEYIVNELIAGPQAENLEPVLPKGTTLRSVEVENGVCTVDLSYDFLENRPLTANGERLAVYALVNSLTELDSVYSVRITVEEQQLGTYLYLNLSAPVKRDESAIGPIRPGLNEFDGTVYLYSSYAGLLVGVPMRLRRTASQTTAEAALYALIQTTPPDGLSNPVPAGTRINSLTVTDGLCSVDLSNAFLEVSGSYGVEQRAVRAIVSTLCKVPDVRRVQLTVDGRNDCLQFMDISSPLTPQFRWSVD